MAREVELKLEIDPAQAAKLRSHPALRAEPQRQRLVSTYFDTPKGKLRRNGWVLRVRQLGDGWVQTVKRSCDGAGLYDRDEWEVPVESRTPDRQAISATPLKALIGPRQLGHLQPVFRTEVERSTWQVNPNGARAGQAEWLLRPGTASASIEIAYDEGSILAGEASEPICELELELKDGDAGALFEAAREIAKRVPVRIGVTTKSERGFALTGGGRHAVKAPPLAVSAKLSVADGFAAIVAACIRHFRLNEPLLARSRDAEAMHQVRVATRRLRTALWLFRPAVRDSKYAAINERLRKLTRELGAARNIDVILTTMSNQDPAWDHLQRDRERLYIRILKMLETRRFRLFMLDLLAWTHDGDWRDDRKAKVKLARFACKRLDKLWQDISEAGARLSSLSDEARHTLRIDAKKMRYALEFLGGINPSAEDAQKKFIKAAEGVQDVLGHLNDLATRRAILSTNVPDSEKDLARCLRAAKRYLSQMTAIGPFWRETARAKNPPTR